MRRIRKCPLVLQRLACRRCSAAELHGGVMPGLPSASRVLCIKETFRAAPTQTGNRTAFREFMDSADVQIMPPGSSRQTEGVATPRRVRHTTSEGHHVISAVPFVARVLTGSLRIIADSCTIAHVAALWVEAGEDPGDHMPLKIIRTCTQADCSGAMPSETSGKPGAQAQRLNPGSQEDQGETA